MDCNQCRNVFQVIGSALNSPVGTVELLELASKALVEQLDLKGCHFRLISRDQKILEHVASHGLSEKFLAKGPVDAERSMAEALQGKLVMIRDCSTDPRVQYPIEHAEEGIVSLLTVPLVARGQVIGVMRLSTAERREFQPEELEFFKVAALFCSSTILHSLFHNILDHVTRVIRSSLNLDEVLNSIVRVITEDLRAKGCTIQLLDRRGKLDIKAHFGLSHAYLATVEADPGKAARTALKGECVPIFDARSDPQIPYIAEAMKEGISSMLYVPLNDHESPLGVLCLYTHRPYEFSQDEMFLLTSLGEQCALAIRNAQMYATLKSRYDSIVDDFQQWFEHYHSHSISGREHH